MNRGNFQRQILSSVVIATTIILAGLGYTYYRKKRSNIPKKWTTVAKVKKLFIYPLKSGRRREIESAECTPCGLRITENNVEVRDRCLIVYGEKNNEQKTARTYPKLILIDVLTNNEGNFILTAPGQDALVVKLPNIGDEKVKIKLHSQEPCETLDCGAEASEWLSLYLLSTPSGLRLGYYNEKFKRNIVRAFPSFQPAYPKLKNDSAGLFQDLVGYLLINQSSIDTLNEKCPEKVAVTNFRPNILVEGPNLESYCEENWEWIKIGDVVFRNIKPCTRCTLTTVDPEEGYLNKSREPLKTLLDTNNLKDPAHIKAEGKSAVMGIYLTLKKLGSIAVGDEVSVA